MKDVLFSTRREFLKGGLTILSAAPTIPAFLSRAAFAMAENRPEVDRRVLVVIQLAGGNDGLNTVAPIGNDAYYRLRPRIAIPARDAIRIEDGVGLHPQLGGFASMLDQGNLTIIQGVGYPNPNRSHFKSTDIWSTGDPRGRFKTGWLGRYFDNCCVGEDQTTRDLAISFSNELPLAMQGSKYLATTFQGPQMYQWLNPRNDRWAREAFEAFNAAPGESDPPSIAFLRRTALDAKISSEQLRRAAKGDRPPDYPNHPFANQMAMAARMIAADLPTRIYYVSLGGFDTHANQQGPHQRLLGVLSQTVKAFFADLKKMGQSQRVLAITFSEFGRRVAENASGGTDHGTAAPMFLFGEALKGGLAGSAPSLSRLSGGDLIHSVDFRSVYASVMEDWLEVRSRPVLGGIFKRMRLLERLRK
jgi:uncharacterized protein (DUF1501 family)